MTKLETFELAFRDGVGSCRGRCACGREFYNPNGGWDWDDGEIEALEADTNATAEDYAIGYLTFEGRTVIDACDCWHERAKRITAFITGHAEKIAAFLREEKARKIREAERAPLVEQP